MTYFNLFFKYRNYNETCNELIARVVNASNANEHKLISVFEDFWLELSTNYKDRCEKIAMKISDVGNDIKDEKLINDCVDNLRFLLRNEFNLFVITLFTVKRNAAINLAKKYEHKPKSYISLDDLAEYNLYKIHYFDDLKAKINEIYRGEEDEDYNEEITPKNINDFLTFLKKENLIDVYSIVHHDEKLQKFEMDTIFIVDKLEDIYFQIIETALINYYYNN